MVYSFHVIRRDFTMRNRRRPLSPPEASLLARGERVVRVPPRLMAGRRRSSRQRGKSGPIDALAVARAALEEGIDTLPVAVLEGPARQIKLLLDHREDLVCERTRIQPRSLPPAATAPATDSTAGGNRQLNAAVHRIAVTQLRVHQPSQDYITRRLAEGKTKRASHPRTQAPPHAPSARP
jgi:transposase